MYWYYKYPLIAILALILFGIGYNIYKRLPEDVTDKLTGSEEKQQTGPEQTSQAEADDTVSKSSSGTSGLEKEQKGQGDSAGDKDADKDKGKDFSPRRQQPPSSADLKQLNAAEAQLESDNFLAARTLARKVIQRNNVKRFDNTWMEAAQIISKANTKIFNSNIPAPEKKRYEVRSGDTLVEIADKFNTTVGALIRGNKRISSDSATIYPGMTVSIYHGDWSIIVDKSHFLLLLMDGDNLFKFYSVAVGKHDKTPPGTFIIHNKLRNPDWTPPGRVIPFGDEENVLGTRWLGFKPTGDTNKALTGYGIHGTWEPETIGTNASQGCIRLKNKDVEELFDIVPRGIKVTIRGEKNE
mgnify:CR=1 FL=1